MFVKVLSCCLIFLKLVSASTSSADCRAAGIWKGQIRIDRWCKQNCPLGHCPENYCKCKEYGATDSPTTPGTVCSAIGPWKGRSAMDNWCVKNCARGYCPSSHCKCGVPGVTEKPTTPSFACRAVGLWKGLKSIENWCVQNCPRGNCPARYCKCTGLTTTTTAPTTLYTEELSTRSTRLPQEKSTLSRSPSPQTKEYRIDEEP